VPLLLSSHSFSFPLLINVLFSQFGTETKYDEALSSGYPIATGVIEGACRYLIKDRLDITGARWRLEGAEAMLKLRALIISGDFEEYFIFHKQQEQKRNYPYYEEIKHKMIA
jgi:hypothetical protein